MSDRNIVYIGKKPAIAYCLALMSILKESGSEASVLARGRSISTAVDVVEITRGRFLRDLSVKDISIDTEELDDDQGNKRNVSNIRIDVRRD